MAREYGINVKQSVSQPGSSVPDRKPVKHSSWFDAQETCRPGPARDGGNPATKFSRKGR